MGRFNFFFLGGFFSEKHTQKLEPKIPVWGNYPGSPPLLHAPGELQLVRAAQKKHVVGVPGLQRARDAQKSKKLTRRNLDSGFYRVDG